MVYICEEKLTDIIEFVMNYDWKNILKPSNSYKKIYFKTIVMHHMAVKIGYFIIRRRCNNKRLSLN